MPRIEFLEDFAYKPIPQQTYLYKKGDILLVKEEIAQEVIKAKKGKLTSVPVPPSGINETLKKFPRRKRQIKKET